MGTKLCTCTKPNKEDRLEDRPQNSKTLSKRLKSRIFGRKKDATVDVDITSDVICDNDISKNPIKDQGNEVSLTSNILTLAEQEEQVLSKVVLQENVIVVPVRVETSQAPFSNEEFEVVLTSTTTNEVKMLPSPITTHKAENMHTSTTKYGIEVALTPPTTDDMIIVSSPTNTKGIEVVPTPTIARGIEVQPTQTITKGIEVVPMPTSLDEIKVVSTPTSTEGIKVVPTSTTNDKAGVVSTPITTYMNEVVPTSTITEGIEEVPTPITADEVEMVPLPNTTQRIQVVPKPTTRKEIDEVPTLTTEKVSSSTTSNEVEVTQTPITTQEIEEMSTLIKTEEIEVFPTSATNKNIEAVPTSTTTEDIKVVSATTAPEDTEVTATPNTFEEVKVLSAATYSKGIEMIKSSLTAHKENEGLIAQEIETVPSSIASEGTVVTITSASSNRPEAPTSIEGIEVVTAAATTESTIIMSEPIANEESKLLSAQTTCECEGSKVVPVPTTDEGTSVVSTPNATASTFALSAPTVTEGSKVLPMPNTDEGTEVVSVPTMAEENKVESKSVSTIVVSAPTTTEKSKVMSVSTTIDESKVVSVLTTTMAGKRVSDIVTTEGNEVMSVPTSTEGTKVFLATTQNSNKTMVSSSTTTEENEAVLAPPTSEETKQVISTLTSTTSKMTERNNAQEKELSSFPNAKVTDSFPTSNTTLGTGAMPKSPNTVRIDEMPLLTTKAFLTPVTTQGSTPMPTSNFIEESIVASNSITTIGTKTIQRSTTIKGVGKASALITTEENKPISKSTVGEESEILSTSSVIKKAGSRQVSIMTEEKKDVLEGESENTSKLNINMETKQVSKLIRSQEKDKAPICIPSEERKTVLITVSASKYKTLKTMNEKEHESAMSISSSKKNTQSASLTVTVDDLKSVPVSAALGTTKTVPILSQIDQTKAMSMSIRTIPTINNISNTLKTQTSTMCYKDISNSIRKSSVPVDVKENTTDFDYTRLKETQSVQGNIATVEPTVQTLKETGKDMTLANTTGSDIDSIITIFEASEKIPCTLSSKENMTGHISSSVETSKKLPAINANEGNKPSHLFLTSDESKHGPVSSLNKEPAYVPADRTPEKSGNDKALSVLNSSSRTTGCTEETEISSNKLTTTNKLPVIKSSSVAKNNNTPISMERENNEMLQTSTFTRKDNSLPILTNVCNKDKSIAIPAMTSETKVLQRSTLTSVVVPAPAIVMTDETKQLPVSSPENRHTTHYDLEEKRRKVSVSSPDGVTKQTNDTFIIETNKVMPVSSAAVETKKVPTNTGDSEMSSSVRNERELSRDKLNDARVLYKNEPGSSEPLSVLNSERCTEVKSDDKCKNSSRRKKHISSSRSTPSKTADEAREPFRKLAIALKASNSKDYGVNQLKTNNERSTTAVNLLPQSSSMTTTRTNSADNVQKPVDSSDGSSIVKSQSLPVVSTFKTKVSEFPVPKSNRCFPMKPLKLKPYAKHMFAIPAIAKTDIEDVSQVKWTQKESSSAKAQMPWMSRRPQFDVAFPPLGKSLLERFGTINRILANWYVPQTRSIEVLKLEHNRFPGLKLKTSDTVKYPNVLNLTASQTSLADRKSQSSDTERT